MYSSGKQRREWLILVVTGISVVALVAAGLSSYGDPDLAGRAALARLSGEVANAVVLEWEQLRRDPSLLGEDPVLWSKVPARAAAPSLELVRETENVVVDALLAEARRLERDLGEPAQALNLLLELLDRELDRARLAETRLAVIQLAMKSGRPEVAGQQWEQASGEFEGFEALGGVSVRLLCALAAGPALGLEQRARIRDDLVTLWITGRLALPPCGFPDSPLREAYRQRLQLLPTDAEPDSRLADHLPDERARALADLIGHPITPPADGGALVLESGTRELVCRATEGGSVAGRFQPAGTAAARLRAKIESANLASDGFRIPMQGEAHGAGVLVREATPLPHHPRGFVVLHDDPDSVVSAVGERQALLRTALLILAAGVAAAGVSVYRAVRRERHLADLKSRFVANVSHELRTPVASILLMAENLEADRITDPAVRGRYHHMIRREAERLRQLVDDVLDFSRIERGKGVHLALVELDVARFAAELEAEARKRVLDGELIFHQTQLPDSLRADGDALRRATLNLIDNALKHSGTGDVELDLQGDGEGGLRIRVRDRGQGIGSARLEALFEPFERVEHGAEVAGTGLGLAIVREIAEGHGGSARASKREGPGLCFEIHIPAVNAETTT